jgi:NADPH-dependent ferric siderophore reductase
VPSVERVRHETRFRLLSVAATEQLTPALRRVLFEGDLEDFHSAAADDHVKLFFPADGGRMPVPQSGGPSGLQWSEDEPRPAARDYTPRRFDASSLVVDFVLHGDGPAASWARAAAAGDVIGQGGPRGSRVVSDDFDWYLLAGDETAIPSIARRLEELPASATAIVLVEIASPRERFGFETEAQLELRWLERGDAPAGSTHLLDEAIAELPLDGDGYAWVAAEAETARRLRSHLRTERGLPQEFSRVTGYWKLGAADWHDPPE